MVVLDGELAVPCTRNPLQRDRIPPRGVTHWDCFGQVALKIGSYAAEACEPRQVREEATVSSPLWVP